MVNWRTNFLITVAVFVAVAMALLMSQLDNLQTRLGIPTIFVVNVTVPAITSTPLPTVAIPSTTPSPLPTVSPSPAPNPDSTAIAVLPKCGRVPPGWVAYVVQRGDTLFSLATQTQATIQEIVLVNCLEPNLLLSGVQIFLPSAPPIRPQCGPPWNWVQYKVQPGDTLYSLALSRGTRVYTIMQANCLISTYLYVGTTIFLPPLPVTATWTPIPTELPTETPTTSATPSQTVTPSITASPTPSSTPQPSATATPSLTPSLTATPTAGSSATPTSLPPVTETPTLSATPTTTASSTPSPTATTPVPTETPTDTPSPQPTDSPTATVTVTETAVPSPSSTSTPTETPPPATP